MKKAEPKPIEHLPPKKKKVKALFEMHIAGVRNSMVNIS